MCGRGLLTELNRSGIAHACQMQVLIYTQDDDNQNLKNDLEPFCSVNLIAKVIKTT